MSYELHRGRLLRTAMRLLGEKSAAEDAVQETWVRALKNYRCDSSDPPPVAWLHRVTVNICYDQLRSGSRRVVTSLSEEDLHSAAVPEAAPMTVSDPEEEALRAETKAAVNAAVDALPPALREVIILREYGELKYAEIAEAMSCPIGTVMSRLYVARKRLRVLLSHLVQLDE